MITFSQEMDESRIIYEKQLKRIQVSFNIIYQMPAFVSGSQ